MTTVALFAALSAGCGGGGADKGQKHERPPAAVSTAVATAEAVPIEVSTVGTVVPMQTVSVMPRVGGQITAVKFKEGQDVEKGALLFEIDAAPYAAAVAQAEAVLARDTAQMENADAEAARYTQMLGGNLVSPQESETKQAAAKALRATVGADKAALDNAKLNLSWTRVTSPISGRADKRQIDVGNVVQPNGATPVVVIRQTSPIQVAFSIPQEELAEVQQRMKSAPLAVRALVPQHPGSSHARRPEGGGAGTDDDLAVDGVLSFLGGAVDAGTGTIPCKADFENKDDALWPGAYVRVVVTLGTRDNAVVMPAAAVSTSQQGPYAYVVKADNTVEMRPVVTVGAPNNRVVVEKGVTAGEKVVVDGQLALIPGSKIAEKPPVGGGAGGAAAKDDAP